jgi:hypothetical protein
MPYRLSGALGEKASPGRVDAIGIEEELNVTNHSKIRADDWA